MACAALGSPWLAVPVSRPHSRKVARLNDLNVEKVRLGSSVHWDPCFSDLHPIGVCHLFKLFKGMGLNPCLRSRLRLARKGAGGVLRAKARSEYPPFAGRFPEALGINQAKEAVARDFPLSLVSLSILHRREPKATDHFKHFVGRRPTPCKIMLVRRLGGHSLYNRKQC